MDEPDLIESPDELLRQITEHCRAASEKWHASEETDPGLQRPCPCETAVEAPAVTPNIQKTSHFQFLGFADPREERMHQELLEAAYAPDWKSSYGAALKSSTRQDLQPLRETAKERDNETKCFARHVLTVDEHAGDAPCEDAKGFQDTTSKPQRVDGSGSVSKSDPMSDAVDLNRLERKEAQEQSGASEIQQLLAEHFERIDYRQAQCDVFLVLLLACLCQLLEGRANSLAVLRSIDPECWRPGAMQSRRTSAGPDRLSEELARTTPDTPASTSSAWQGQEEVADKVPQASPTSFTSGDDAQLSKMFQHSHASSMLAEHESMSRSRSGPVSPMLRSPQDVSGCSSPELAPVDEGKEQASTEEAGCEDVQSSNQVFAEASDFMESRRREIRAKGFVSGY